MKVCIDAGHGSNDSGAVSSDRKRYEKNDNLTYAKQLKKALERCGIEVITTRDNDNINPSLDMRCQIEKDAKCDAFISCHRNGALPTSSANGVEIWLHTNAPQRYFDWAKEIIAEIKKTDTMGIRNGISLNRVSEGVYRGYPGYVNDNFAVNRDTISPSMLIELGFMSSDRDSELFDAHYKEYCEIICKATCGFLGVGYVDGEVEPPVEGVDWKKKYKELQKAVVVLYEEFIVGSEGA